MNRIRRAAVICLCALFLSQGTLAEPPQSTPPAQAPDSEAQRPHLNFNDFLNEALRYNLDLAAQRTNIAISQAAVTTASVTPDWSANFGLPTIDLSSTGNPTVYSFGLDVPFELGGKRGHRVRAARPTSHPPMPTTMTRCVSFAPMPPVPSSMHSVLAPFS